MIEWNDDLHSVGIRKMDDQHKQLIGLINALDAQKNNPDRAFLSRVIDTLVAYTKQHFKDEERILQKIGFPNFAKHHVQHEKFIQHVGFIKGEYERMGASPQLLTNMIKFLSDWIINHILIEDKAYRTHLES